MTVRAVQAAQGVARWSRAWDGRRVHARGCPARSACSLGVRAVPPGHGRSLLPAVRAMGTTRTSYKHASFPTVVPMVPRLPGVLDTCYGPSMRADCLRKETAMDHQLTGHLTWSTDPTVPGWQLTIEAGPGRPATRLSLGTHVAQDASQ